MSALFFRLCNHVLVSHETAAGEEKWHIRHLFASESRKPSLISIVRAFLGFPNFFFPEVCYATYSTTVFFVWKMFIYSNSNTSHLHNYYAILRCISWSECIIWSDFYGISIEFRIRALWLDQNFVLGAMMPEWWETASDPETSLPRHDAAT